MAQCHDHQTELEQKIENPNIEDRVRFIEGQDLSPLEIKTKCEEVLINSILARNRLSLSFNVLQHNFFSLSLVHVSGYRSC